MSAIPSAAPEAEILKEIAKFQRQQKRYPATSELSQDIGRMFLAPLFAEMARRKSNARIA